MRIFIILGLAFFFGLSGIVAGYIFVPLAVLLLAWGIDFSSQKKQKGEALLPASFSFTSLARLALPITLFLILFEIFMSFDIYLLKYLLEDDKVAGLYSAALSVARIPTYLFYALTLILLPLTAEARTPEDEIKTQALLQHAFRFMFFLSWPFLIFSAAYSESLIQIFFGEKFLGAAPLLPLLALGTTLLAMLYVLSFAYKGRGLIRIPLIFLSVGILLNLLLDFFLLPHWGLSGVATAKAATALLLFPFFFHSLSRTFRVSMSFLSLLKVFFVSVVLFLLARMGGDTLPAFFSWGTFLFLGYFAILIFLREITSDDLALVKGIFSKKKTSTKEIEVSTQE